MRRKILPIFCVAIFGLFGFGQGQEDAMRYFNIATKKAVTVNATCGENIQKKETYCKLVGYDSQFMVQSSNQILQGQICDFCLSPETEDSEKAHPGSNAVDGDINTWWQSPPISRGLKYNRVTLAIDLQQTFQVAYVTMTMANSPRPGVWALERSNDGGQNWQPWQYFAGNDVECQKYFGMHANEKIIYDDQVTCITEYSSVLPIEDGEVYVSLTKGRPSAKSLWSSKVLLDWLLATNIRFRFIQTKTMLGHLMSVAQGDKTVTRRYYYSIKEISVGGRCVCNGHAYVCPPSEEKGLLKCQCQHNTAGTNCDQCAEGFVQKPWRPFTKEDPYECEPCNCNGHSNKCHYDQEIDQKGLSMDIHGNYQGGGVCDECQHNTEGINCDTCTFGFFRPVGVPPNATDPCQPCDCGDDPRYSGNCAPGGGQCECKEAFRGAEDCSACADGYYDYPDCKPCDCFANGTVLMENGLPFCVAEGTLQCPCLENFSGAFCDECAEGFFGFPDCNPCECNPTGSKDEVCNRGDGQCECKNNYAGRQCDECQNGFYNYPYCEACDCDTKGTTEQICDVNSGQCLCKEGFGGPRCDECLPGFFDYPNCQNCNCSEVGSNSKICDVNTGQCPCFNNYGGRQCSSCSVGHYAYPDCNPCSCRTYGSKGTSCDDKGQCNCKEDFQGLKCGECVPERYNFPLCEPCNCNPDGVTEDFFEDGGCDNVPEGSLCTCKDNVMGRICDTCKPLFWNLQSYNPLGCENCDCFRPGTIGSLGICDTTDGQCACKPNVDSENRFCKECKDGFFALNQNNGLGCQHCQCDVGGTQIVEFGKMPVCDKESGQCTCRTGIEGRQCNQVSQNFFVPTLHQYKYEIEDGYRADASSVRIGYDDAKFPGYSWRGYGAYSQLQDEVLLPVTVPTQSSYRMVLRYTNPNPVPILGEIKMESDSEATESEDAGTGISVTHKVLLPPTGNQPAFVTVSGERGIYASPFDLKPDSYTTSVKIPNADPQNAEVLVDYFVLLPRQYYEPSILKENVYEPCLAGETLPICRHYSYPEMGGFPKTFSGNAERPGGGAGYAWNDNPEILAELATPQLASIAKWQPELVYPMDLDDPGKHVLAVAFFTPEGIDPNSTSVINVQADNGDQGQAYIFDCKYSTLCRQVVTDSEGRIKEFDFPNQAGEVTLKAGPENEEMNIGIDSVIAIPLKDWHLDLVTPISQCVRKNGVCIAADFPNAPDESVVIPFNNQDSNDKPEGIIDDDSNPLYVDANIPIPDLEGKVPAPGLYVLVAQYYQPDKPTFELPMNITYANPGEELDIPTLIANGQFYEAVLPLPTCRSGSGCRSVVQAPNDLNLNEAFSIHTENPDGNPVWLESITAIPKDAYDPGFLNAEPTDGASDFAMQCGLDHFDINPQEEGYCQSAIISLASDFNDGAQECNCDMTGSVSETCEKIGGQCPCKDHVIGRQCTRCKPGFFGYPDCKQCNCPPTAQCNEENGECICAPHVTGTEDAPCSKCEENTFGYDPITGCQECMCETIGTVNGSMSCDLESGSCYCKDHVVGRTCDNCEAGYYQHPDCLKCPCDVRGTTEEICNQDTSKCLCKPNVEGESCDSCIEGTFDLQQMNADGCTNCFCSGKTSYCTSHPRLVRMNIENMEDWEMTSFKIGKTLTEKAPNSDQSLPNYSGELAISFTSYPDIDLNEQTLYFKAPEAYLRNQINSAGGAFNYKVTYSGYNMQDTGSNPIPDLILSGNGISLLYHANMQVRPNEPMEISALLDPYVWNLPDGAYIKRRHLMSVLANLTGIYIRASYGLDSDGQSRLSQVVLESAVEVPGDRELTDQDKADQVTSVELCECPEGYYGYSCEDCAPGYYTSQEDKFGVICAPCDCNGHADTCHPKTGECVSMEPKSSLPLTIPEPEMENICHFRPDLCVITEEEHCLHNTTGSHCENCAEGFFGDATTGNEDACESCPCPLPENNFAYSCDALLEGATEDYCKCKPNYAGGRCEYCGPGYYGEPEVLGDYCKPCECNGNIDSSDVDSCDNVSGICLKCLDNTSGDHCERCKPWFFGDAINLKDCRECLCERRGTELCDHLTGACQCLPGVEGQFCDRCQPDHWGFESDSPGCTACECSEASITTQCNLEDGQCQCKEGVTGQKCDRCKPGFYNLGPDGCEPCGCNIELTVGGTCNSETGQCECMRGVVGQNCDGCPPNHIFLAEETRAIRPAWKAPFDYDEGCFPCSTCISDLLSSTDSLKETMEPIMNEYMGVTSAFLAKRKLENIEDEVETLGTEIQLLVPQEGERRLQPLENQLIQIQQRVKSLNVDYKLNVMAELDEGAKNLGQKASDTLADMSKVKSSIEKITKEMEQIADGLGSGVTPDQIKTAIDLGNEWLDEMKLNDFSADREAANKAKKIAQELVLKVKDFAKPVEDFKGNVGIEEERVKELDMKLDDLQINTENAKEMLNLARSLNFKNGNERLQEKNNEIRAKSSASEGNIQLGKDLNNEANDNLNQAQDAFVTVNNESQDMERKFQELDDKVNTNQDGIGRNSDLLTEALEHANELEARSANLKSEVDNAKSPAARTLEAANAYSDIAEGLTNGTDLAMSALQTADEAASMAFGIGNKATQALARTQELYEAANNHKNDIGNSLQPKIETATQNVTAVAAKNKATKNVVEFGLKSMDAMNDLTEMIKEAKQNATDAETVAHDALTSIDARYQGIKESMVTARNLQDDSAEMQLAIDATKKALNDLENSRRPKRDAEAEEEVDDRLQKLRSSNDRINNLMANVKSMVKTLKGRLKKGREVISAIDTGISFTQGSHLELQLPPKVEELAINTHIQLYFNVTKSAVGGRAFIFYLGNVEETHTKLPSISTDDYMAVEITEGGYVKLTMNLGAGISEVTSNNPITYGQWHQLDVDRRGYYVTLTVRSEEGREEVIEDTQMDVPLKRYDMFGRPFGAVFNLHKDYSKMFVGGFPSNARIQETIRATNMDGQIEGLTLAGTSVGLWNFKDANELDGAISRDKLLEKPVKGLKFDGRSYLVVDRTKHMDIVSEFHFSITFKAENRDGLLLFIGDGSSRDYAALEIRNGYLTFSFNLGEDTASLESAMPVDLGVPTTVAIDRRGRFGEMKVNGQSVGIMESQGSMDQLSVGNEIYIGGYRAQLPTEEVQNLNFDGCIEEFYFGPDKLDLSVTNPGAYGVKPGCEEGQVHLATFPAASPGYMQLNSLDLQDRIELSFMFKTSQSRALLLYMHDTPASFYYLSLSLMDGSLNLNVFPDHSLGLVKSGEKATLYNDSKWHSVSILIQQSVISLHIDDYAHFKVDVPNQDQLPLLNQRYHVFMGGVPAETVMVSGASPTKSPFIGCIRDVLIETEIIDFNSIIYHTGVEMNSCTVENSDMAKEDVETDVKDKEDEIIEEEDFEEPEEDPESEWGEIINQPVKPPEVYGKCKLPILPAFDPEVTPNSGLRFGNKRETYLEFNRRLRGLKKRSDFGIELKTNDRNGIIFYIADDKNSDFIALFVKNGKLVYGFNCGSGPVYIESPNFINDERWHFAEFSRQANNGKLYLDGNLVGESKAIGPATNIEVGDIFHLGGLPPEYLENSLVRSNLKNVQQGFVGCLKEMRNRGEGVGKWSKNPRKGVVPCSDKVEPGYFFGPDGGFIIASRRYLVGLDFDITMQIKPRNISGVLLAIQGRRDYLILQMIDGTMTFTVDNGRGPITAVFKPESSSQFCDGNWHEIHAVKAKNVVTLSVDDIFAQPGIGVPGVSSTDTNHGLFIGGHPRPERLTGLQTSANFVGCIKNIIIENNPLDVNPSMLKGDILSNVCPTI